MNILGGKLARFSTQPSAISWNSVIEYIQISSVSVIDGSANEELRESFRQEINLVFRQISTEIQNSDFIRAFSFVINFISENISSLETVLHLQPLFRDTASLQLYLFNTPMVQPIRQLFIILSNSLVNTCPAFIVDYFCQNQDMLLLLLEFSLQSPNTIGEVIQHMLINTSKNICRLKPSTLLQIIHVIQGSIISSAESRSIATVMTSLKLLTTVMKLSVHQSVVSHTMLIGTSHPIDVDDSNHASYQMPPQMEAMIWFVDILGVWDTLSSSLTVLMKSSIESLDTEIVTLYLETAVFLTMLDSCQVSERLNMFQPRSNDDFLDRNSDYLMHKSGVVLKECDKLSRCFTQLVRVNEIRHILQWSVRNGSSRRSDVSTKQGLQVANMMALQQFFLLGVNSFGSTTEATSGRNQGTIQGWRDKFLYSLSNLLGFIDLIMRRMMAALANDMEMLVCLIEWGIVVSTDVFVVAFTGISPELLNCGWVLFQRLCFFPLAARLLDWMYSNPTDYSALENRLLFAIRDACIRLSGIGMDGVFHCAQLFSEMLLNERASMKHMHSVLEFTAILMSTAAESTLIDACDAMGGDDSKTSDKDVVKFLRQEIIAESFLDSVLFDRFISKLCMLCSACEYQELGSNDTCDCVLFLSRLCFSSIRCARRAAESEILLLINKLFKHTRIEARICSSFLLWCLMCTIQFGASKSIPIITIRSQASLTTFQRQSCSSMATNNVENIILSGGIAAPSRKKLNRLLRSFDDDKRKGDVILQRMFETVTDRRIDVVAFYGDSISRMSSIVGDSDSLSFLTIDNSEPVDSVRARCWSNATEVSAVGGLAMVLEDQADLAVITTEYPHISVTISRVSALEKICSRVINGFCVNLSSLMDKPDDSSTLEILISGILALFGMIGAMKDCHVSSTWQLMDASSGLGNWEADVIRRAYQSKRSVSVPSAYASLNSSKWFEIVAAFYDDNEKVDSHSDFVGDLGELLTKESVEVNDAFCTEISPMASAICSVASSQVDENVCRLIKDLLASLKKTPKALETDSSLRLVPEVVFCVLIPYWFSTSIIARIPSNNRFNFVSHSVIDIICHEIDVACDEATNSAWGSFCMSFSSLCEVFSLMSFGRRKFRDFLIGFTNETISFSKLQSTKSVDLEIEILPRLKSMIMEDLNADPLTVSELLMIPNFLRLSLRLCRILLHHFGDDGIVSTVIPLRLFLSLRNLVFVHASILSTVCDASTSYHEVLIDCSLLKLLCGSISLLVPSSWSRLCNATVSFDMYKCLLSRILFLSQSLKESDVSVILASVLVIFRRFDIASSDKERILSLAFLNDVISGCPQSDGILSQLNCNGTDNVDPIDYSSKLQYCFPSLIRRCSAKSFPISFTKLLPNSKRGITEPSCLRFSTTENGYPSYCIAGLGSNFVGSTLPNNPIDLSRFPHDGYSIIAWFRFTNEMAELPQNASRFILVEFFSCSSAYSSGSADNRFIVSLFVMNERLAIEVFNPDLKDTNVFFSNFDPKPVNLMDGCWHCIAFTHTRSKNAQSLATVRIDNLCRQVIKCPYPKVIGKGKEIMIRSGIRRDHPTNMSERRTIFELSTLAVLDGLVMENVAQQIMSSNVEFFSKISLQRPLVACQKSSSSSVDNGGKLCEFVPDKVDIVVDCDDWVISATLDSAFDLQEHETSADQQAKLLNHQKRISDQKRLLALNQKSHDREIDDVVTSRLASMMIFLIHGSGWSECINSCIGQSENVVFWPHYPHHDEEEEGVVTVPVSQPRIEVEAQVPVPTRQSSFLPKIWASLSSSKSTAEISFVEPIVPKLDKIVESKESQNVSNLSHRRDVFYSSSTGYVKSLTAVCPLLFVGSSGMRRRSSFFSMLQSIVASGYSSPFRALLELVQESKDETELLLSCRLIVQLALSDNQMILSMTKNHVMPILFHIIRDKSKIGLLTPAVCCCLLCGSCPIISDILKQSLALTNIPYEISCCRFSCRQILNYFGLVPDIFLNTNTETHLCAVTTFRLLIDVIGSASFDCIFDMSKSLMANRTFDMLLQSTRLVCEAVVDDPMTVKSDVVGPIQALLQEYMECLMSYLFVWSRRHLYTWAQHHNVTSKAIDGIPAPERWIADHLNRIAEQLRPSEDISSTDSHQPSHFFLKKPNASASVPPNHLPMSPRFSTFIPSEGKLESLPKSPGPHSPKISPCGARLYRHALVTIIVAGVTDGKSASSSLVSLPTDNNKSLNSSQSFVSKDNTIDSFRSLCGSAFDVNLLFQCLACFSGSTSVREKTSKSAKVNGRHFDLNDVQASPAVSKIEPSPLQARSSPNTIESDMNAYVAIRNKRQAVANNDPVGALMILRLMAEVCPHHDLMENPSLFDELRLIISNLFLSLLEFSVLKAVSNDGNIALCRNATFIPVLLSNVRPRVVSADSRINIAEKIEFGHRWGSEIEDACFGQCLTTLLACVFSLVTCGEVSCRAFPGVASDLCSMAFAKSSSEIRANFLSVNGNALLCFLSIAQTAAMCSTPAGLLDLRKDVAAVFEAKSTVWRSCIDVACHESESVCVIVLSIMTALFESFQSWNNIWIFDKKDNSLQRALLQAISEIFVATYLAKFKEKCSTNEQSGRSLDNFHRGELADNTVCRMCLRLLSSTGLENLLRSSECFKLWDEAFLSCCATSFLRTSPHALLVPQEIATMAQLELRLDVQLSLFFHFRKLVRQFSGTVRKISHTDGEIDSSQNYQPRTKGNEEDITLDRFVEICELLTKRGEEVCSLTIFFQKRDRVYEVEDEPSPRTASRFASKSKQANRQSELSQLRRPTEFLFELANSMLVDPSERRRLNVEPASKSPPVHSKSHTMAARPSDVPVTASSGFRNLTSRLHMQLFSTDVTSVVDDQSELSPNSSSISNEKNPPHRRQSDVSNLLANRSLRKKRENDARKRTKATLRVPLHAVAMSEVIWGLRKLALNMMLQFEMANDSHYVWFGIQLLDTMSEVIFMFADHGIHKEDAFVATLMSVLIELIVAEDSAICKAAATAWSRLLKSELCDFARDGLQVAIVSSGADGRPSEVTYDLWQDENGGFCLLKDDNSDSSNFSKFSDAVVLSCEVRFQSWYGSLPDDVRTALNDKLLKFSDKLKSMLSLTASIIPTELTQSWKAMEKKLVRSHQTKTQLVVKRWKMRSTNNLELLRVSSSYRKYWWCLRRDRIQTAQWKYDMFFGDKLYCFPVDMLPSRGNLPESCVRLIDYCSGLSLNDDVNSALCINVGDYACCQFEESGRGKLRVERRETLLSALSRSRLESEHAPTVLDNLTLNTERSEEAVMFGHEKNESDSDVPSADFRLTPPVRASTPLAMSPEFLQINPLEFDDSESDDPVSSSDESGGSRSFSEEKLSFDNTPLVTPTRSFDDDSVPNSLETHISGENHGRTEANKALLRSPTLGLDVISSSVGKEATILFDPGTELRERIQQMLLPSEIIILMMSCKEISGVDLFDCVLVHGSEKFYLARSIDNSSSGNRLDCRNAESWGYREFIACFRRRYQLRQVGLELFFSSGLSKMIIAPSVAIREAIFTSLLGSFSESGWVMQSSSARREIGLRLKAASSRNQALQLLLGNSSADSSACEKWMNGEMSNFDYLMHLNMVSGRTTNDWNQYPVFPWVLRDYSSSDLRLDDESVFRDLSKPMGCINPDRELEFRERYEVLKEAYQSQQEVGASSNNARIKRKLAAIFSDVFVNRSSAASNLDGVIKPFHYGTHYSTSTIVMHYMVRLQPFTDSHIHLQNGNFDKPDRLFQSIESSWNSAAGFSTLSPDGQGGMVATAFSTQDVKELIPEFYYLPDFLVNQNNYNMGKTLDDVRVHDVVLPPWANNSPREFIRLHRMALESDYVSRHLHEWIDLIFGYKQKDQEGEKAGNMFYFLTYEGEIDLATIEDESIRAAYVTQIDEFGQTPSQLLNEPHPKRKFGTSGMLLNDSIRRAKSLTDPQAITVREPSVRLQPLSDDEHDVNGRFWRDIDSLMPVMSRKRKPKVVKAFIPDQRLYVSLSPNGSSRDFLEAEFPPQLHFGSKDIAEAYLLDTGGNRPIMSRSRSRKGFLDQLFAFPIATGSSSSEPYLASRHDFWTVGGMPRKDYWKKSYQIAGRGDAPTSTVVVPVSTAISSSPCLSANSFCHSNVVRFKELDLISQLVCQAGAAVILSGTPTTCLLPPEYAEFVSFGWADGYLLFGVLEKDELVDGSVRIVHSVKGRSRIRSGMDSSSVVTSITCSEDGIYLVLAFNEDVSVSAYRLHCPGRILSGDELNQPVATTTPQTLPTDFVASISSSDRIVNTEMVLDCRIRCWVHENGPITRMALSNSHHILITSDSSLAFRTVLWDFTKRSPICVLCCLPSPTTGIEISADNGDIALSTRKAIFIFDGSGRKLAASNDEDSEQMSLLKEDCQDFRNSSVSCLKLVSGSSKSYLGHILLASRSSLADSAFISPLCPTAHDELVAYDKTKRKGPTGLGNAFLSSRLLLTGHDDGCVRLWQLREIAPVESSSLVGSLRMEEMIRLRFSDGSISITAICFDVQGSKLVIGTSTGVVIVAE